MISIVRGCMVYCWFVIGLLLVYISFSGEVVGWSGDSGWVKILNEAKTLILFATEGAERERVA